MFGKQNIFWPVLYHSANKRRLREGSDKQLLRAGALGLSISLALNAALLKVRNDKKSIMTSVTRKNCQMFVNVAQK